MERLLAEPEPEGSSSRMPEISQLSTPQRSLKMSMLDIFKTLFAGEFQGGFFLPGILWQEHFGEQNLGPKS